MSVKLVNVIERGTILSHKDQLGLQDLPAHIANYNSEPRGILKHSVSGRS